MNRPNLHDGRLVYILQAISWQDALLQSYRNFQLILQSIFAAVGAGLTIATISLTDDYDKYLTTIVLFVLGSVSLFIMFKLRVVIKSRGEDVWYWQRLLINLEGVHNPEHHFCNFKVHQIIRRTEDERFRHLLNRHIFPVEELRTLIEESDPITRNLLEKTMTISLTILWAIFFSIALSSDFKISLMLPYING